MDAKYIVVISLISLSGLSLILLIFLQIWLPNRFLKHPGQLFFYSCIFQLIDTIKNFTYIGLFDGSIENESLLCRIIGFLSNFAYYMQFNYMAFLSVEIIIKLRNNTDHRYHLRTKLYHIYSFLSSLTMSIVIFESHSFGKDSFGFCSIKNLSVGENINIIYVFCLLPIMWISIFFTFYKIHTGTKRMAFSLSMVVLILTLDWVFGRFFPKILDCFHIKNAFINELSIIIVCSSGLIISFARLLNKKLKDDIIYKYKLYKLKKKKLI